MNLLLHTVRQAGLSVFLLCFAVLAWAGPGAEAANVSDYFYDAPTTMPPASGAADKTNKDEPHSEPQAASATKPKTEVAAPELVQARINNEFWYVLMLGGLCLASLSVVLYFLHVRESSAKDMVNSAGLILIIFGTIILVLVVTTSEQLTAAIGVLGAIAGYLFRSVQEDVKKPAKPDAT